MLIKIHGSISAIENMADQPVVKPLRGLVGLQRGLPLPRASVKNIVVPNYDDSALVRHRCLFQACQTEQREPVLAPLVRLLVRVGLGVSEV